MKLTLGNLGKKAALAGLLASFLSSAAQALTLDFGEVASGFQGSTTVTLSNATVNSFGDDLFVYGPGQFGRAGNGGFCGISGGSCEAGAEVLFNDAVSNLTFDARGFNLGDFATLSIFDGATLLSSTDISADTDVSFAGFSNISRLFIQDSSTGAGFDFTNFEFDASVGNPVPAPATLVLIGIGLLGFGASRRNR